MLQNKKPEQAPKKRATSWGNVADWYDNLLNDQKSSYQRDVILPNLVRLLGIKHDDVVVDIACGQGFFTREFAAAGAIAHGSDIAEELIALAKKYAVQAGMKERLMFDVAPSDKLAQIADASADFVTIISAIQNIENVAETFAECGRVVKCNGTLCIVMNHPAFRVPKESEWGWTGLTQYRRVNRYMGEFNTAIQMKPGSDPSVVTTSFHRPLQFYFKMLKKTGFCVTGMEEWVSNKKSDSGSRAAAENRARNEFPLFLCLLATKHSQS
jgi:ubiquinone/menaquinone biosynthesis C-methylase UbiE